MRSWSRFLTVAGLALIGCNSVDRGTAFTGGQGGGGGAGSFAVSSTSPDDEAIDVPLTTAISATFSTNVDTATVTLASFSVSTAGGLPVSGLLVKGTRTVTLEPDAPLSALTLYVATLTTTIRDVAGDTLAAAFVWRFTTVN